MKKIKAAGEVPFRITRVGRALGRQAPAGSGTCGAPSADGTDKPPC